jgi:hypothetical protein
LVAKNTSFSGLKQAPPKPKLDPRYRCHQCFSINKLDNLTCQKCGWARGSAKEESKQESEEAKALEDAVSEWGGLDIDQLEDMREDILDRISELEAEATSIFAHYALEKLVLIIGNILQHPTEDKYKTLKVENQVFYSNIGRFATGISFIKAIGFETRRLPETNKLAYFYAEPVGKDGDLHPKI